MSGEAAIAAALVAAHRQRLAGDAAAAEAAFRDVLARAPDHPDALHLLADLLLARGEAAEAAGLLERAAAARPDDPGLWRALSAAQLRAGQPRRALEAACHAPGDADALHNAALALRALGREADADQAFAAALAVDPGHGPAGLALARRCLGDGDVAGAEDRVTRVLAAAPGDARAHTLLGLVRMEQGRAEEAAAAWARAAGLDPAAVEPCRNLGNALRRLGRAGEAETALREAVRRDPCHAGAAADLAALLRERRRFDDAAAEAARAVDLDPARRDAWRTLGHARLQAGDAQGAAAAYDAALASAGDDPGIAVRRALVVPVAPDTDAEIDAARRAVTERLDALRGRLRLSDPLHEVGVTAFYLAYHGRNDRAIQGALADLYLEACPDLAWTAPHAGRRRRAGRLRVAVVSAHLWPGHTIGKLNLGLLARLPRDRIEVTGFAPGRPDPALEAAVDAAVGLPRDLGAARRRIAEAEPDVVFYPDIGMEPFTYFLAFARLAPVQAASWGHPVTTGIPNVDAFLSTPDLDPPGNEAHYRERLLRIDRLPVVYEPPATPEPVARAELGLPGDGRLYVCPQSLFKMHPDMDALLEGIVRRDPSARVAFIGGAHERLAARLRRRWAERLPAGAIERVHFLPPLPLAGFLGLCAAADVVLDTPHFGGGNSSLEAFAVGAPVVTLPSGFLRGRITLAEYRRMGTERLVAADAREYADLAVRCANDAAFRADAVAEIEEGRERLWRDGAAAEAVANAFAALAAATPRC